MSKVLILGATGYLGSFVTKSFIDNGDEVSILSRNASDFKRISSVLDKIRVIELESADFLTKIKEFEFDIFINASVAYGRGDNQFSLVIEVNLLLPIKILSILNKSKSFVFFTFDSFYSKPLFSQKDLMPEYVLSKIQLNEWLSIFNKKNAFKIIVLRIEHLIGPNESVEKFNGWLLNELKSNRVVKLTSGLQIRDFIHVNDIISAIFLLTMNLEKLNSNINYFEIGSGVGNTMRDFIELLHEKLKSNSILDFNSLPMRENEILKSIAENKVMIDFGWRPITSLIKKVESII